MIAYGTVLAVTALLRRWFGREFGTYLDDPDPMEPGERPALDRICTRCGLVFPVFPNGFHAAGFCSHACRTLLSKRDGLKSEYADMRRTTLALVCLLSGCSYLGSAREWDPAEADPEFVLISEIPPIRQKDSVGCGPVALAMVLRHCGERVGPEELTRELPPAGDAGSTAGALRDLARRLGYKAHVIEGTFEDLEEHLRKGRPLIVGLVKPFTSGAVPHYEVVVGIHPVRGSVATVDPVRGWTLNSREGFLEEWAGSGRLLLVIAPPTTSP